MQGIGHFSLWGDFELDDITKALELEPSWTHDKGAVLEGADSSALVATWDFYCPEDSTLNEQIEFLLTSLWPRADALRVLAGQFKAAMNLTASGDEGWQELNLDLEMLKKLVSMNVTLNCFYVKDEDAD